MTAITAFAMPNAAYLLTDTAAYKPDGLVQGFSCKAVAWPHLDLVMATTGTVAASANVFDIVMRFNSCDELLAELSPKLREAWDDGEFETIGQSGNNLDHFRVTFARWNRRERCGEVFAVSTLTEAGCEPFEWHSGHPLQGNLTTQQLEEIGVIANGAFCALTVDEILGRIIDKERRTEWTDPFGVYGARYLIGGHAIITTVASDGISHRVVRRWNDRVWDYIDPSQDQHQAKARPALRTVP